MSRIGGFQAPDVPRFTCTEIRNKSDRERRGSASDRGYDSEWKRLRGWHLKREMNCRICCFRGKVTKATMVNHNIPVQDAPQFRLDKNNLTSACKHCHDTTIRALEDMARKLGDITILRDWMEDPSLWPRGWSFTAKAFPRMLRDKRARETLAHEDRSSRGE